MNESEPNLPPGEFVWPLCPACGRRRFAVCPYCQSSGDRFANTEVAWEADHDIVRVVCPTCDEPFQPQFRGLCHGCGHVFDPITESIDPPSREPDDENSRRAMYALFGIIAVLAALGAYFAWLLR